METNELGEFETRLEEGEFRISTIWVPDNIFFLENVTRGTIEEGQDELNVGTLAVPRLHQIHGIVVDRDDNPIAFSEVSWSVNDRKVGGGTTDADGNFIAVATSSRIDRLDVWVNGLMRQEATVVSDQPLILRVE